MSLHKLLLILLAAVAAVPQCQAFTTSNAMIPTALQWPRATKVRRRHNRHHSPTRLHKSSSSASNDRMANNCATPSDPPPPPPQLRRASLPSMLAGGLFLFATSVPSSKRAFADRLLELSEDALRSDPTVAMELGMGIEAGGIYACSSGGGGGAAACLYRGSEVERLVLQFQIDGGNAWAQGVAYGVRDVGNGRVTLLALEVANMDAVLNDRSFRIPLKLSDDIAAC